MLPSDGELHQPAQEFLRACGLTVERPSVRRYTGIIPTVKDAVVLFQRASDVAQKVEEGSAELGVTGLDRFLEFRREEGVTIPLIEDLGFGSCELVVAAPVSWLDVTSMNDLADVALEFRKDGRQLRIATKYPRLVRRHLLERGINHFSLVPASGTLEAAPAAGYADLIADITATGNTLRENRLRPLDQGTVLVSQACLIGNRVTLAQNAAMLQQAQAILEMMEGYLRARPYYRLSANVRGPSQEAVASRILARPDLSGLQGPTVSQVYNVDGTDWYAVNLVITESNLLQAVQHLRQAGGIDISASRVGYLFKDHCFAYERLLESTGERPGA